MAKVKTTLDLQNDAIRSVCAAIADHMIAFNVENNGEAFHSFTYAGKTITAVDRAHADVAKQFDELANGSISEEQLPCVERNLIVALLQKNALKVFATASAEYEQEQRKLAKEKDLVARAKKIATDPTVRRTRAKRVASGDSDGDLAISYGLSDYTANPIPEVSVNIVSYPPEVSRSEMLQDVARRGVPDFDKATTDASSALSQLSAFHDPEPTL